MPEEVELKLLFPAGEAERVAARVAEAAPDVEERGEEKLLSLYYDTPTQALRRLGLALRLRTDGRSWVQTVKGEGRVQGGIHARTEWEVPLPGPSVAPEKVPDKAVRALLRRAQAEGLRPLFETAFRRRLWLLRFPSGDEIEAALDLGEIRAGERREPIAELELELLSGSPRRLRELERFFRAALPVRRGKKSKARRGYELAAS